MKQLSIEEKAKAYDEALAKAIKIHRNYKGRVRAVDVVIEEVFPELEMSEDERIRKALIDGFTVMKESKNCGKTFSNHNIPIADILAWLEKQGEQKPTIEMKTPEESLGIDSDTYNKIVDECVYGEQKPADKVEPKFKVGDWIVDKQRNILYVKEVYDSFSKVIDEQCRTYNYDNQAINEDCHLWTIQDAKDGDVLSYRDGQWIFIYKGIVTEDTFKYYALLSEKGITVNDAAFSLLASCIIPAAKEQRDFLFQRIHEAGYEWDADKKELKKIEPKTVAWTPMDEQRVENLLAIIEGHGYPGEVAWLKSLEGRVQSKQDEQKVAWSEEDDKILKSIIINIENLQFSEDMREKYHHIPNANKSYYQIKIDWLESLKDRVQLQPKEWSEEDKAILEKCIGAVKVSCYSYSFKSEAENWLKSLRPQSQWKPSLSQLNALGIVAKGNPPDDIEEIKSLYNDLHKLIN